MHIPPVIIYKVKIAHYGLMMKMNKYEIFISNILHVISNSYITKMLIYQFYAKNVYKNRAHIYSLSLIKIIHTIKSQ